MNSMVNPTALTKNNAFLQTSFGDRLLIPFLGLDLWIKIEFIWGPVCCNPHKPSKPMLTSSINPYWSFTASRTPWPTTRIPYSFMIGARRISLRKIFSTEKSLKLFENGYHELQHDEEFDELKNVVNDWMTRRLQKSEVLGSSYMNHSGNLPAMIYHFPVKKSLPRKLKLLITVIVFLVGLIVK